MSFTRNLDFFTIEGEPDFPTIIDTINKLPRDDSTDGRILTGEGYAIALTDFKNTSDSCEGIIVRLRTNDLPVKGDLFRNVFSDIPLGANEGLAEMTFFFYSKYLNVLCLLSAKNGVKYGTFMHYITEKGPENNRFLLNLLLSIDALQIFRKFRSITSIKAQIKISNDSSPASEEVKKLPLGIALDETKRSGAARLIVELYNKKRNGGLAVATAKKVGDAFRKLAGYAEVEHLVVKGSESPEFSDHIIDLISQRFKLPVSLGESGGRHLNFQECQVAVRKKINANEDLIKQLLG